MHYLCSSFGSSGDIHPMLGLALALQQRGHRVTFLANGYFEELVRSRGVEFIPVGTKAEFLACVEHPDLWNPRRSFAHIWSYIQPVMRDQYRLFAEHNRPGETVGIVNCFGLGGLVAQDRLGIPVITAHMQPAVIWSDLVPPRLPGLVGPRWLQRLQYRIGERFFIDRVVCPELNRFRAELNLAPVRQITRWWHSKWCVACLFPEWYAPPQDDWPANRIQTGFPLWDEPTDQDLPPDVEAFLQAGESPIAFTPGSANTFGRHFFETAVSACQRLGRRGILLSRFPEQIPQNLPPSVRHFAYVPFSALLPRTLALVHHGGIGSTAQALAAGVPQLVVPLAHDQFDNAARLKRFGVGDWLTPERFRTARVAGMLQSLLTSDQVRRACQNLAGRIERTTGLSQAAEQIERLGAEPIVGGALGGASGRSHGCAP